MMDSFLRKEMFEIVADGAFGKNVSFVSFKQAEDYTAGDQYASVSIFGDVITSDESKFHVMIKLKPRDNNDFSDKTHIDDQFHNEITMYDKIIPFLLNCCNSTSTNYSVPSLPNFLYGRNRCGEFKENDIIVLENVAPLGFCMSEERLFLDYDHLVNAIQALARFHGMSYVAKHNDPQGFGRVMAGLWDPYRDDVEYWLMENDVVWKFGKRGVDGLLERSGHLYRGNGHLDRFSELIAETGGASFRRTIVPREPFAVLCHGDFNRNNVMFRYGGDARPVDTLLVDFGTPRYGSPALDLSFFLYMNTTQEMRRHRWDELVAEYCATLAAAVPPGVLVPGRAEVHSEMAASALYGFVLAAFFLPLQIDDRRLGGIPETETPAEMVDRMLSMGGEAGTGYVADMVQHLVDMGYTNV